MLRVTVADNGPGIPAHLRARVFEPYFTTKPIGIGTGVGLAVSLGIVEAHGGTLTVDCPTEGGAVFTITLPVGACDAAGAEAEPPPKATPSQRTILIVDDEAEIRETLAEILTGARHRVVTVELRARSAGADGSGALRRDPHRHPHARSRRARALPGDRASAGPDRRGRVVFVTGDTLASALREFVSESGRPVIEKPFLPSEVRRVVAELAGDGDDVPPR